MDLCKEHFLSIKLHISSHRISKIELKHWQSRVKNIWLSQQLPYLIPFWSSSRMLPRAMENVNELTIYLRQIPIYKLCFSSTHFLLGRFYVFNLFPPPPFCIQHGLTGVGAYQMRLFPSKKVFSGFARQMGTRNLHTDGWRTVNPSWRR